MTFEEVISAIGAAGCRVNNLFQLHDGRWQANIRTSDERHYTEFAVADEPIEALRKCLDKCGPVSLAAWGRLEEAIDELIGTLRGGAI